MALPGAAHTFGIEGCRDLLGKLEWEIACFKAVNKPPELQYHAFNCAVTAWHLTDWVWRDLRRSKKTLPGERLSDFKQSCASQSPALHLCGFIANASKHGGVRVGEITTEVWVDAEPARVGDPVGQPLARSVWRVTVGADGYPERDAIDVFQEAFWYWTQRIYGQAIDVA
jgi:hypothetical protein